MASDDSRAKPPSATAVCLELPELPSELRRCIAEHVTSANRLERLAGALREVVESVNANSSSAELEALAAHISALAEAADRSLAQIHSFAGQLEGLGSAVAIRERSGGVQ